MTDELTGIVTAEGMVTFAYIDGPGTEPAGAEDDEPRGAERGRIRSVRDRLEQLGAPSADVEAIAAAMADGTGIPSPSARYLLAQNGSIVVDEAFAGPRLGSERLGCSRLPEILPLLRHRSADVRYLVVSVDREGAEVRLERASQVAPELSESIDGEYDRVQKVRVGDLSQARIQRSAEEMWKRNLDDVVGEVDELVRSRRPAFVVIAGDVRARQLLREKLAAATADLVIEVDAHTAPGSDDSALDEAIASAVHTQLDDAVAQARDRAATDQGSTGAYGVGDVVAALQQASVDTLVLDSRGLDTEDVLLALGGTPWVAASKDDALTASVVAPLPIPEALARAALLTGARVLVEEHDEGPADAPRNDTTPRKPFATLRWEAASL